MEKVKTCAVIGLGRFGRAVVHKLFDTGCEVLAVDSDSEKVAEAADFSTRAVSCDAKNENALKELGLRNYDCAVVAIGNRITDSVLVTLMLKEMGVRRVICKASDENHRKILLKIGADNVIIPEYDTGVKLAMSLVSGKSVDYIELSDTYGIAEVEIPAAWINKTLIELDVRRKYSVSVIGVRTKGGLVINPPADYKFISGDVAVIIGKNNALGKIS